MNKHYSRLFCVILFPFAFLFLNQTGLIMQIKDLSNSLQSEILDSVGNNQKPIIKNLFKETFKKRKSLLESLCKQFKQKSSSWER